LGSNWRTITIVDCLPNDPPEPYEGTFRLTAIIFVIGGTLDRVYLHEVVHSGGAIHWS
jgi:hypothetical protein